MTGSDEDNRVRIQDGDGGTDGCIEGLLWTLSIFHCCITFPLSLFFTLKKVQEYERAVIFRLRRVKKGGAVGPGRYIILPCTDVIVIVDMRTVTFDVPPQEILTKDSVTVTVDAVVFFKIHDPMACVIKVKNAYQATRFLASTTLRNMLGTKTLHVNIRRQPLVYTCICILYTLLF